jgi:acetylornithine deacetylase/succinyl-diaminopimelate desuccinylase-like protein
LKDGKLYGRGVCDHEGGMACSLLAATLLAERRDAWSGEIVLTLAGDEENMGSLGTGWMPSTCRTPEATPTSAAMSARPGSCASARRA